MGHADARTLSGGGRQQRILARLRQHHAARVRRRHADDGARRHRRLYLGPDQMAWTPPDRRDGVVAMDDAGHRLGRRLPVGLRAAAARHPDLRDNLGAAVGLYFAGYAALGSGYIEPLCPIVLTSRRVLAHEWRELA